KGARPKPRSSAFEVSRGVRDRSSECLILAYRDVLSSARWRNGYSSSPSRRGSPTPIVRGGPDEIRTRTSNSAGSRAATYTTGPPPRATVGLRRGSFTFRRRARKRTSTQRLATLVAIEMQVSSSGASHFSRSSIDIHQLPEGRTHFRAPTAYAKNHGLAYANAPP